MPETGPAVHWLGPSVRYLRCGRSPNHGGIRPVNDRRERQPQLGTGGAKRLLDRPARPGSAARDEERRHTDSPRFSAARRITAASAGVSHAVAVTDRWSVSAFRGRPPRRAPLLVPMLPLVLGIDPAPKPAQQVLEATLPADGPVESFDLAGVQLDLHRSHERRRSRFQVRPVPGWATTGCRPLRW